MLIVFVIAAFGKKVAYMLLFCITPCVASIYFFLNVSAYSTPSADVTTCDVIRIDSYILIQA